MARRLAAVLTLLLLVGCEACDGRPRTVGQLVEQYAQGVRDFREVKLRDGADLSDGQLEGVDLRGAVLRGIQFYQANLSTADLRGADLRGSMFNGTRLTGARLEGAQLARATYSDATIFPDGFDPKAHSMIGPPPPAPEPGPKAAKKKEAKPIADEIVKAQAEEWKKWDQLAKTDPTPLPPKPEETARTDAIDERVRCFKGDGEACLAAAMKLRDAYRRGEQVSLNVRQSFDFLSRACARGKGCGELRELAERAHKGIEGVPDATAQRIVREAVKLGAAPDKLTGSTDEGDEGNDKDAPSPAPEEVEVRDGGPGG